MSGWEEQERQFQAYLAERAAQATRNAASAQPAPLPPPIVYPSSTTVQRDVHDAEYYTAPMPTPAPIRTVSSGSDADEGRAAYAARRQALLEMGIDVNPDLTAPEDATQLLTDIAAAIDTPFVAVEDAIIAELVKEREGGASPEALGAKEAAQKQALLEMGIDVNPDLTPTGDDRSHYANALTLAGAAGFVGGATFALRPKQWANLSGAVAYTLLNPDAALALALAGPLSGSELPFTAAFLVGGALGGYTTAKVLNAGQRYVKDLYTRGEAAQYAKLSPIEGGSIDWSSNEKFGYVDVATSEEGGATLMPRGAWSKKPITMMRFASLVDPVALDEFVARTVPSLRTVELNPTVLGALGSASAASRLTPSTLPVNASPTDISGAGTAVVYVQPSDVGLVTGVDTVTNQTLKDEEKQDQDVLPIQIGGGELVYRPEPEPQEEKEEEEPEEDIIITPVTDITPEPPKKVTHGKAKQRSLQLVKKQGVLPRGGGYVVSFSYVRGGEVRRVEADSFRAAYEAANAARRGTQVPVQVRVAVA